MIWLARSESGALIAHMQNVELILANDERWAGVISYSAFSSKIVKLRAAPYGGGTGDWADIDDVRVMKWLAQQYNLRVKASHVIEAVSVVAQAAAATVAMAVPTKVSADYGAIIRDISIKAGIANKPEEAQLSKTIIGTSRDTGMARNQVAEVVNALVGAGMELDKALQYAPTAAKFAVGQGSDGTETARMINALGQNAKITDPAQMQKALEAIAYQGQAGSFEAADMARWFPELLAGMGKLGITGMDSVSQRPPPSGRFCIRTECRDGKPADQHTETAGGVHRPSGS